MAKDRVTSDNYKVVIHPDCVPRSEHERRFNAPTTNEIAAVVVKLHVLDRVAKQRFASRALTAVVDGKIKPPNLVDEVISAEIPNPETDQKLYDTVTKNMIHGPCGALNPSSPCMKE
ncbi:ATP-dependent DNA helicase [Trichonephila clavipes]|uniref:ATP-dependent DNA helicase n=1 Tax=Trichonephila clavipes TaxID=2585209 RepID=A0A8X6WI38_TRICX|nr:ATP-dependent DNA helicase [Trichonephila clavipes]